MVKENGRLEHSNWSIEQIETVEATKFKPLTTSCIIYPQKWKMFRSCYEEALKSVIELLRPQNNGLFAFSLSFVFLCSYRTKIYIDGLHWMSWVICVCVEWKMENKLSTTTNYWYHFIESFIKAICHCELAADIHSIENKRSKVHTHTHVN